MSARPFEKIIKSQPFKLIVGKEKKEFLLHSALVASKSDVLDKMMNGRFAEARQGCAVLADVDADTMVIFAEFLYKGDYDLPHPIQLRSRVLQRGWREPVDKYWSEFTENVAYGYIPSSPAAPILSEKMGIDYSDFFISHAKVFIFAECYGVEDLMDLSMRKLHQSLCGFRPSLKRISDVLALVRFCYDNPAPEKLKELLASYLACYAEAVFLVSGFKKLLRKNGDFAADLACAMASRFSTTAGHEPQAGSNSTP